jgi:hypothetical protein
LCTVYPSKPAHADDGRQKMSTSIKQYLDGMVSWGSLVRRDRVWLCANRPEFCPLGAMLDFAAA